MKKIMVVLILFFIAWLAVGIIDSKAVEPDAVFPMCNQHIEWHYATKP